MRYGISGAPVPSGLPFAAQVMAASATAGVPPCLVYAIKVNETGLGRVADVLQDGALSTGLMPDGSNAGHGIFQLTSSWPLTWADPQANANYAVRCFISPAIEFWNGVHGYTGDALVRCVAASFNAGVGAAWLWHVEYNNVDAFDTDHYGARALKHYHDLILGKSPTL
jgi:hypothetical protein